MKYIKNDRENCINYTNDIVEDTSGEAKPGAGKRPGREEGTQKESIREEGDQEEGAQKESIREDGVQEKGAQKEGTREDGDQEKGAQKEGTREDGVHEKGAREEGAQKESVLARKARERFLQEIRDMAGRKDTPYTRQMIEQTLQLLERGVQVSDLLQEMRLQDRKVQINHVSSCGEDQVSLHSHVFYELLYVAEGSVEYLLGARRYHIRAGDLVFIPPGMDHSPLFPERLKSPYVRFTLWIDAGFFEEVCGQCRAVGGIFESCVRKNHFLLCARETGSRALELLCENLYKEAVEQRPGWELSLAAGAMNMLVGIGRNYHLQGEERRTENTLVDEILCYIDTHLSERFTLEEAAGFFHVSKSTVTHLFRKELGVPFYRCVVQRRLLAARYRMSQGVPLRQVCEECGFPDYSAFYRLFRKEYGISPREYARLHPSRRSGIQGKP